MSKSARTDEIDALVSSVRDFVSHKEPRKSLSRGGVGRLVLTPEQRVADVADMTEKPTNADTLAPETKSTVHRFEDAKRRGPANLESALSALGAAIDLPVKVDATTGAAASGPDKPLQATAQTATSDSVETPNDVAAGHDITAPVGEIPPVADHPQPGDDDDVDNLLAAADTDAMAHEVLHTLITEIVQEELTGELGERMTRNVRKLVRREINRVLASRELGQD